MLNSISLPSVRAYPRAWPWWLLAFAVLMLDQVTKHWAEAELIYNHPRTITSFFNFTLRYNPGAAFSFLADQGGWQRWFFGLLAALVSMGIVVWIARIAALPRQRMETLALTLILGGALGNLYDRVMLGHVVDFIVVHYQQHAWPAFNIADAAICIGAGLLVLDMIINPKPQEKSKP